MATVTGTAGTSINAVCTVSDDGQPIAEGESAATAQSIVNDLATIASGNVTIAGAKTFSGPAVFSNAVSLNGATTVAAGQHIRLTDETSLIQLGASGFSRTRVHHVPYYDATLWAIDNAGNLTTSNATSPAVYYIETAIPHGVTITGAFVRLLPPGAHVGLPGAMPSINIRAQNIVTGAAATLVGSQTDTSASLVAYEAIHSIVITGASHVFDATRERVVIEVIAEGGANALVGTVLYGVALVFTQPNLES